jgi:hypothetical protein
MLSKANRLILDYNFKLLYRAGFKNIIRTIKNQLRRYYYFRFRKEYIAASIAKRQGSCKKCGKCCEVMIFQCVNFEKPICKIWQRMGFEQLPHQCQVYPFDESDKNSSAPDCGYYWRSNS